MMCLVLLGGVWEPIVKWRTDRQTDVLILGHEPTHTPALLQAGSASASPTSQRLTGGTRWHQGHFRITRAVNFDVRWLGRLVALVGPPPKRLGIFVTDSKRNFK